MSDFWRPLELLWGSPQRPRAPLSMDFPGKSTGVGAILSSASPALAGGVFTTEPHGKPVLSTQLIPVKQLLCVNTAFEAFSSQEAENVSRFFSWSNN